MMPIQSVKRALAAALKNSRMTLSFLGLLAFSLSGSAVKAADWKEVTSKEDQFSISMPGEAQFKNQNIPTALGPIEAHEWSVDISNDLAYMIMVNQYPAAHVAKVGPTVLLDNVLKGQVGSEGKIRSQKSIQVQGYPGREAVIEKGKFVLYSNVVMVSNRLYQMVVAVESSKESTIASDVKKYFNSFKLLK